MLEHTHDKKFLASQYGKHVVFLERPAMTRQKAYREPIVMKTKDKNAYEISVLQKRAELMHNVLAALSALQANRLEYPGDLGKFISITVFDSNDDKVQAEIELVSLIDKLESALMDSIGEKMIAAKKLLTR